MFVAARVLASATAAVLAGLLAAGVATGQAPAGDEAEPVAVTGHSARISEVNALVALVDVQLSGPARALVEYWNESAGRFRTRLSDAAAEHQIPVVRLRVETTYHYRIGVEAADGGIVFGPEDAGEFTTGAPPDPLGEWEQRGSGRSTQPLILGDLTRHLVYWDDEGRIVWYYKAPPETEGIGAVQQLPNGNLLYEAWRCCLREVSPLGVQVGEYSHDDEEVSPHHDFLLWPDGRIVSLAERTVEFDDDETDDQPALPIVVDTLSAWERESGATQRLWDALDFWEIVLPGEEDWEFVGLARGSFRLWHGNSIQVAPRGNVIVSFRNRRQIISIVPDFQSIEWKLGGRDGDYSFPDPRDQFYGQHSASELANGNILLFDNGLNRPEAEGGRYSRALELRLDDEAMTAVKVWEHRLEPDLYQEQFGSAYRLANGNTLVNFGVVTWPEEAQGGEPGRPIVIVEVDAAGREVFRLETQGDTTEQRYRAYGGIGSIMGETRVPTVAELRAGLVGAELNRGTTWRGGMATTASDLLGALVEDGARTLHLYDGTVWRSWAAPVDGESVPGAQDFLVVPGAVLWIGG